MNKEVTVLAPDGPSERYSFLKHFDKINLKHELDSKPDVFLVLDCPTLDRTGKVAELIKDHGLVVNIDHHQKNSEFGAVNYIDTNMGAVGQQIYKILIKMPVEITAGIAEALYVSCMTDTGNFRFSNTTPDILKLAAELLPLVKVDKIYENVYESRTEADVRLIGEVLSNINTEKNGEIVWSVIPDGTDGDTEGVIDYLRSVNTARVAVLFRELTEGGVKISLRSRGNIDVSKIAAAFGGGGHKAAAGASLDGPMEKAVDSVLGEVRKWTDSSS
jgi:phosphoesterase RecJ-like protein